MLPNVERAPARAQFFLGQLNLALLFQKASTKKHEVFFVSFVDGFFSQKPTQDMSGGALHIWRHQSNQRALARLPNCDSLSFCIRVSERKNRGGVVEDMKSKLITLLFCALTFTAAQTVNFGQGTASPDETVHSFYAVYLHSLNQGEDPLTKRRTELRKFVTSRLMSVLDHARKRGLEYDFFLDAQDFDKEWEQNITAEVANIKGSEAIVNLTLQGGPIGEHKLRIGLKKQAGGWKIDSVNARTKP